MRALVFVIALVACVKAITTVPSAYADDRRFILVSVSASTNGSAVGNSVPQTYFHAIVADTVVKRYFDCFVEQIFTQLDNLTGGCSRIKTSGDFDDWGSPQFGAVWTDRSKMQWNQRDGFARLDGSTGFISMCIMGSTTYVCKTLLARD